MNLLSIPIPIPSGSTISSTANAGAAVATPSATLSSSAIFKGALTSSLAALAGKTVSKTSTTTATTSVDGDLVQRIKAALDRGTSPTDVIASLSNSLAASVAVTLGIPLDAAKQQLTAAFTAALTPTGAGPPQTNAERATSLAQRFRQVADLATRVTKEDPGQTIRSITGTSSDAEQAGAKPAPSPDSIIRDAIVALAGTASSATQTTLGSNASNASVLTSATAQASDGRIVALPAAQAIATGGDTPLGRMLARAVINDPHYAGATAAPVTVTEDAVTAAASDLTQRSAPAAGKSLDAQASAGSTNDVRSAPAAARATTTNALDAFVSAFNTALRRGDGPRSTTVSDPSLPSIPVDPTLATGPAATPQQIAASLATPVANTITAIAPPAPASTMPQPVPADPNAVVDQVLRGVNIRTTDGSSEVRLRLVPESLGDVSVKLVVTGGSVDASITTHTADAQSVLAGAQTQLAKSLADAGLKLQSFTVGLAGGSFAGTRDQQSSGQWTSRSTRRIGAVDEAGSDEAADPSLLAVPSFGPSIYATNPAHGLNYLV